MDPINLKLLGQPRIEDRLYQDKKSQNILISKFKYTLHYAFLDNLCLLNILN